MRRFEWNPGGALARLAGTAVLLAALAAALRAGGSLYPDPRQVVFLQWWETELGPGVLEGLIREFEESSPGVSVVLDTRSREEVRDYLLRGPAAGEREADVLGVDPRWLALLEDPPSRLEPLQLEDGERLSQPLFQAMVALFYNTELLEEAGFDRPPKTWEDMQNAARLFGGGGRGFSLALAGGLETDFYPWFWAAGRRVFDGPGPSGLSGGAPHFDGPDNTAVLRFLRDLYLGGFFVPEPLVKTDREKLEDFKAGRAAMILAPVLVLPELRRAGLPLGISTVPHPASYVGKPLFGFEGRHAALLRGSRFKALSRSFIAFLAEKAPLLAAAGGGIADSGTGAPVSALYAGDDPLYAKAYSIYEAGEAPEEFAGPAAARLDIIVAGELGRLLGGEQGPEETAVAIGRRWAEYSPAPEMP
ncbi:MAG: extracellular solute-binding protein [Spirochaetaceae bacterium]|jgi:multiple sugar transport system substrate-binding protein|nr:extracellular solute-binding protein [Spirochaetaceae bacterium]